MRPLRSNEEEKLYFTSKIFMFIIFASIAVLASLTIADIIATNLINQVYDNTTIPQWLYKLFISIFFIFGGLWSILEWYLGKINREPIHHNNALNFISLYLPTLVIGIYVATQPIGVFLLSCLITIAFGFPSLFFIIIWIVKIYPGSGGGGFDITSFSSSPRH